MKLKLCLMGLLLVLLSVSPHTGMAQQKQDPLTGTWTGDWGPSATDRNTVILELKWDGKTLTGTVNPGPDAIAIENASFDPAMLKIHIEANFPRRNLHYAVDGTVENDKMKGTWNHPRRMGDFQLTREVKKSESAPPPKPDLTGLKTDDRKVVEYMLKDWNEWEHDYSITSVDMAMTALGVKPSDETRFRIGNYLKNHSELHEVLRDWGWQTFVLTPNEKLTARVIVNAERDKKNPPTKSELARAVGITEKEADNAVRTLERYGILKRNRSGGGIAYVAAAPRYVNWQPWLDFQFHRITLSSGRTFAVN